MKLNDLLKETGEHSEPVGDLNKGLVRVFLKSIKVGAASIRYENRYYDLEDYKVSGQVSGPALILTPINQ